MGVFADEEYGTTNAGDSEYRKKLDANFKLFSQGALSVECIHSNISPNLVKCEICNDSNINFVYILRNTSGNTIKCGTRCANMQRVVQITNFKEWKHHLEGQIKSEETRLNELRSLKRTIIRKKPGS